MSERSPRQNQLLLMAIFALLLATGLTVVMAGRWAGIGVHEAPMKLIELPDFSLVDQHGSVVGLDDLAGSPWVADFIFTRCAGTCPLMTQRMKLLGERLPTAAGVQRVSISVDPDFDTPEVLRAYAERHEVADEAWLFLTGEREAIHRLSIEGFKLAVDPDPPPASASASEPIVHSTRFVLVDAAGVIRGYYDAFDDESQTLLLADLDALLSQ